LIAVVLALAVGLVSAQERRPLQAADRWSLASVGDPQVSPEGDWIAYTVSRNDKTADESRSRIWMVPAAGGDPLPMTAGDVGSWQPRWSPDGRYLAFLSARDGKPAQVWVLNRHGGEAQMLTDTPQSVSDFAWSPDSKSLALVLQDLHPEQAAALAAGEEWTAAPKPWVIDREFFKQDYVGYLDRRRTHIYRFDLDDRQLHQLTGGDFDDSQPAWSPDGLQLAFVSKRVDLPDLSTNTDIFLVSAQPLEQGVQEPRRLTRGTGSDDTPVWSPDGRYLAHITTLNPETLYYETRHLAVTGVGSGDTLVLTEAIDRWVYGPRFSADGQSLLFMLEDSGEQNLVRMPVGGGELERLISGEDVVYAFDPAPDGSVAALVARPQAPGELFLLAGGELQPRTQVNRDLLAGLRLGEVREMTVISPDGSPIETFVILPPGFDEEDSYPAILNIHGGPQAQYDWAFDFESQLLAAQGYVMILPNPRGSTGYGYEFCLAIWRDWGGIDYQDVMAAVDGVVELGWADPERLGVMGWSYGGMLTNHIITRTDRFRAAATGASATLYVGNYGHDEYIAWWEQELGQPWDPEARARFERLSPFNRLDQVTTPTLVVGGEIDWNVPIINSEQLYLVLKRRGIDTQLIVYPDQYHGIDTPSLEQDLYGRYIDWFGKYLEVQ
jgi:dipeptidyl aminopeptidase/acylaminoacyl peptidase